MNQGTKFGKFWIRSFPVAGNRTSHAALLFISIISATAKKKTSAANEALLREWQAREKPTLPTLLLTSSMATQGKIIFLKTFRKTGSFI